MQTTHAPIVTPIPKPIVTPIEPPPYDKEVRSVRFLQYVNLLKEPRTDAEKVGTIRKGANAVAVKAAPTGNGCAKRWIQIAPRGWACETVLEPSRDQPTAPTTIALTDETDVRPAVPGTYGVVYGKSVSAYATAADAEAGENGRELSGAHTVRGVAVVEVDGKKFWRTSMGDLIDASSIVHIGPSSFKGIALDTKSKSPTMPAWVYGKTIKTRATPAANGKVTGSLTSRTIVTIVEESDDGKFVRIGDDKWVARDELRVTTQVAPPAGTRADEKWFDVDLDDQVLVAYEGNRPVYATLVSTGKWGHATPTRITRVVSKLQSSHMISNKGDKYSVADVPWTMFYDGNFALHTSYWHDGFGGVRSHGCINLAPRDARLLYHWSSPDVPPGWIAVFGDEDSPGSMVRVRSRKVPEPEFHGYARSLHEKRTAPAPVVASK